MRKYISTLLVIAIVFSTITCVFAEDISIGEIEKYDLELRLTSDVKEIEIMKSFNENLKFNYTQTGNTLKLKIEHVKEEGQQIFLTGKGLVILNGEAVSFDFEEAELFKTQSAGKTLYDGAADILLTRGEQNIDGILDITMTKDYTDAVASLVIQNPINESQIMLFYGEPFDAQKQLVQKTAETYAQAVATEEAKYSQNMEAVNGELVTAAETGSKFHHVTNKSDSRLDGVTRDKQMLVMSVAKYDPRIKKEENGSELIRVFSRSYNAVKYVDGAVQAVPYRIKADFSCGKTSNSEPFLHITATKPMDGSSSMAKVLSILAPYVPNQTASTIITTALAYAASGFKTTSVKTTDHMGTSRFTKAAFNVLVWDSLNIDKNAVINLPQSTNSSDAEENAKNGVAFIVDYNETSEATDGGKATATCNASMEYRMIMDGLSRYSTVSTGTATVTHTLYGKNYK